MFAKIVKRNIGFNSQATRVNLIRNFSRSRPSFEKPKYTINWILKDGSTLSTQSEEGISLLEVAHKNKIDLEGACEASLACSTCHVIVTTEENYQKTPEPSDEENDMLDLAYGVTQTSRLGCQVFVSPDIDGITVKLPAATRNMQNK
eukprot:TRINITY_DN560_c0_g3_i1.p1 TRINITY_DN560_c0_g3~~TRINITY_DN560_c0_g3_i1.p1  ORF type:complete len:160 (-),score=24.39 TRINITY_DN560_c0_g3_i1:161-601(-)